jgi:cytidylate kinase
MNFITFSEMLGSKGKEISEKVAFELEYSHFGEEKLFQAAKRGGFLTEIMDLDEKAPSLLERFFSQRPKICLDKLQSVIYDEAKKGDIVFLGKGSQMLLNSFGCALHVLVTGSMENRIQTVIEKSQVDVEVAKKIIERSDHGRGGFLRFAFDKDWLDPTLYDLIINTDKLGVESAVWMVVDAAKSDEIKTCGIESVNLLGRLSLERKVDSAILEMGFTRSHLFASVEDTDTVRVYGAVHSPNEKEMIEKRLKKIDEIKNLKNEINLIDMSWEA